MAYLCTETTDYRYLVKLDAPKKWFRTNVGFIMQTYGDLHHLQKEDLFLGQHRFHSMKKVKLTEFLSHRHSERSKSCPFRQS